VVDWARDPFTALARLHDSPDAPWITTRWFVTDCSQTIPLSIINNRIWDAEPWKFRPVGMAPKWMSQWRQRPYWSKPIGLNCDHICHREWFTTGEPWPVTLPDTKYDLEWIPECCGRNAAEGGLEIGGEAGDKRGYKNPTSGGLQIGGQAGDVLRYTDGSLGGVEIGGEAGDVQGRADAASGGVEIGGEAGDLLRYTDGSSGGVEIGGEAGDVPSYRDGASGGVEIGGEAGDLLRYTDGSSGGVEIGGEAGDVREYTDAASGGVEIGGTCGDVYTPPTPVPTATCTGAPSLSRGTTYNFTSVSGQGHQWVKWPFPASTAGHITFHNNGFPINISTLFGGPDCAHLNPISNPGTGCSTFTSDSSGLIWIDVANGFGGAFAWDVLVDTGPC
jgi:hypothetical protein